MKIHKNLEQGSQEWHDLRDKNFTASELDSFVLEPVKVTLTVDDTKKLLDQLEISRKGITKRDDLIALLPNPEKYLELCKGAETAILKKITAEKRLNLMKRAELTPEEQVWLDRQNEIRAKEERAFEYNVPVKYGNLLESEARAWYESCTGYDVEQVGFVECEGYGCSPDGLIVDAEGIYRHGVEIKCLTPENHLRYLLAGVLPNEFFIQVQACMACTGLNRWDLVLYCPGDASLLITVYRDETTEQIEAGLKVLVAEKAKIKAKLSALWRTQYVEEGAA